MLPKILWLTGSGILCILGAIHLYYTFFTRKLYPRNEEVADSMKATTLRLTRETDMWKAWTGFNASHSAGAIFAGLANIILAIGHFYIIESSFPLAFLTITFSLFYLWLAKKYWFSIPFIGLLVTSGCFIASPIASFFN